MQARCLTCAVEDDRLSGYCLTCGGIRSATVRGMSPQELGPGQPPTPLLVSRVPGLEGLRVKFEGTMPTGSFKDRIMRALVSEAVGQGAAGAVVASSGNGAIAASAACAAAGLPLLILVPEATPPVRMRPAELRGAVVVRGGADPSELFALAAELASTFGLADLASTFASPGSEWACRQIGHEVAAQVDGEILQVASSVSAGPVLVGTGHGIEEAGRSAPALVAVQAAGCAPIALAYARGHEEVVPWSDDVTTRAVAIADRLSGYPADGTYTLREVRRSGGFVAAVDDTEIERMRQDLARWDGLDVEFSSCAAPAVLRSRGRSLNGVVCLLTANGFKDTFSDPSRASSTLSEFITSSRTGLALVQRLERWIN